ncbi:MAG: glucuronate isomerase [Candidatus Poribacteria bacterium]|nr:glucuronate isomerase [Candidatus Poribacteria bacterium]
MTRIANHDELERAVRQTVAAQPITDIHTHLFSPDFGDLLLWGVDELLTYHYLIAETFRASNVSYDHYWAMTKTEQADLIWKTLFLENSPISESCRGVVTTLNALGLNVESRDLNDYRWYFAETNVHDFIDRVFELANVESVVMTNDPFDPTEQPVWQQERQGDPRFHAALRIDPLLNGYESGMRKTFKAWGYDVTRSLGKKSCKEIRRFLSEWIERMNPKYMAVSLPPEFMYPENSARGRIIERCVLPVSKEYNVPFALMIGVTRAVNPQLRMAGDGMGKADLRSLENLCRENPDNKFLTTLLSRENQHELCVLGRKFPNLMIFGCWWFMNNPSVIEEITRERIELLGLSVIPQHSDARILDQLVYKWSHSREIIADVLVDKYADTLTAGWQVSTDEVKRDVSALFGENFKRFLEA